MSLADLQDMTDEEIATMVEKELPGITDSVQDMMNQMDGEPRASTRGKRQSKKNKGVREPNP